MSLGRARLQPCRPEANNNGALAPEDRASKIMTWIRTIPLSEADAELRQAMEGQKALYPQEYAVPIHPAEGGGSQGGTSQIVASHSLIPQALHHAFSTYGALLSPDLPLQRRHHVMIATMVSVTNRCVY